jgi:Flp pilus assembly pilin Flp
MQEPRDLPPGGYADVPRVHCSEAVVPELLVMVKRSRSARLGKEEGGSAEKNPRELITFSLQEREMRNFVNNFVNDEQGQDLIEYTLLLAFVALASAAVFIGAGTSISGIWTTANSKLANANAVAAS